MRVFFITTICTMVWLRLGATLCDIGQVELYSKEDVEAFESAYAHCDSMMGIIGIADVAQMPMMPDLLYFKGEIRYANLFQMADSVITGFSGLEVMEGSISISTHYMKINQAFQKLKKVGNINAPKVQINGKPWLIRDFGFNELKSIDFLSIGPSWPGIEGYFGPMDGFENLEDIRRGLDIDGTSFTKFNGFRRLKNIGRQFAPPGSGNADAMVFNLWYNKNLEDLSNFDSLRLYPSQISYVVIVRSPKLSVCHVPFICRYIRERTGGDLKFINNGPGCNSLEEVKSGCLSGTDDEVPAAAASLSIYPNPSGEVIYFPDTEPSATVRIYDITGRLRSETQGPQTDVSGLPPGLYTVTAEQSGSVKKGRFVKR